MLVLFGLHVSHNNNPFQTGTKKAQRRKLNIISIYFILLTKSKIGFSQQISIS